MLTYRLMKSELLRERERGHCLFLFKASIYNRICLSCALKLELHCSCYGTVSFLRIWLPLFYIMLYIRVENEPVREWRIPKKSIFIQTGWSDNFKVPVESVWPTEGSVYSAFLVAAIKITDGLLHEVASCQLASRIIIKTCSHQSTLCVDAWRTPLYWWGLFWFCVIVLSAVCLFNEEKRLF